MSKRPTPKATLSTRIADQLRAQIVSGTLTPGSKINLDHLRSQIGVSISPLREAVARLVAEGLVEFEDQRGYAVSPHSLADLDEITNLRVLLETEALHAAITHGDLDWESKVMGSIYRLERTPRAGAVDWEAAHSAFHMALISGCGRPKLLEFCTVLRRQHDRYRRIQMNAELRAAQADRVDTEHRAIAEAAVAREAEHATALLRAHIEATATTLRAQLRT